MIKINNSDYVTDLDLISVNFQPYDDDSLGNFFLIIEYKNSNMF